MKSWIDSTNFLPLFSPTIITSERAITNFETSVMQTSNTLEGSHSYPQSDISNIEMYFHFRFIQGQAAWPSRIYLWEINISKLMKLK